MFSTLLTSILADSRKTSTKVDMLSKKVTECFTISTSFSDWKATCSPELAGGSIRLWFRSNSDVNTILWRADLVIYVRDMPALMKKGLFISEANVETKRNCILAGEEMMPGPRQNGWVYERRYRIEHVEDNLLQWKGILHVFAMDIEVLREFRIGRLSADKTASAVAFNVDGDVAYHFDIRYPENNFNALLEDLPLKGLWPWPKDKDEQEKMNDREEKGGINDKHKKGQMEDREDRGGTERSAEESLI